MSIRLGEGDTNAAAVAHTTKATATGCDVHQSHAVRLEGSEARVKPTSRKRGLKEETHAARWGLLRGYSGKATKWVDFVMTDSTRRESSHVSKVIRLLDVVKGIVEKRALPKTPISRPESVELSS
jgi:hypothetical protein